MSPSIDRLNQALSGRYVIEREAGSGGMARVYLASDLKHRRKVAIKVLRPELAATIDAERFMREIEIAAGLSHPHILPLFDSGAAEDVLFYVMPFVPGESLRERLAREQRLPVDDALRLAREVSSAIGFAHQQGIIHRDIKPGNILLADGIALVADFGIARALRTIQGGGDGAASALTLAGIAIGTPAYMGPEQFTGDEVDARSDLYSLGCVLFEMLTGRTPFGAATIEALFRMHLTVEPPLVSEIRPTVPIGIARIVARTLAKNPDDRYPTAASFAEAIATVVSGGIPPVASKDASDIPNNLPRQRTRFIGRERELTECARMLGETRLLTLTGIGGSGKTRLALQLAEAMLPSFPGGVWFADFGPLVDAGRVSATVAAAVCASEGAEKSIVDDIREHVGGKRVLLIFDNCEHVLSEAAALADTLLGMDGVRILATSREGFGLEGERLFAMRSMAVDPESDAVRLFVDRARAARTDFELGPTNVNAVVEICRRLDGIPLAIELAAARVKALSLEQIRSRLGDRFKLLTGGRSAVPRQQTLLATIQWSYDQLSDAERHLLRTLSVFAGGWTLESATAVATSGADEFEILDLLTHLIDKSLVLVERTGENEARYSMLETVRQYSLERLIEADEADTVRERHLAEFSRLAERFYSEKFVREEVWTQRLTKEHDNLRTALSFVRERDSERYLQLVGALAYFWFARSHFVEGREHTMVALSLTSKDPVRPTYARALRGRALLAAYELGQDSAIQEMQTALAMWRELGDRTEVAWSLETLGWAQFLAAEDEAACGTFEELVRIWREGRDPVMVNRALVGYAQMLVALSRVDDARPVAREILEFSRKAGDRRAQHSAFHFLADCELIQGQFTDALRYYQESLDLAEAIGDRVETSAEIEGIAMSLAGLGRHADAVRLVAATRAEWARHGIELRIRFWDELHERFMTPARMALGAAQAGITASAGEAMTFEAAISEARTLASQTL